MSAHINGATLFQAWKEVAVDYQVPRPPPHHPHARGEKWLTSPRAKVVTVDVVDLDILRLQQEVLALQQRVQRLVAMLRLLVVLMKVSGLSLASTRIADGPRKASLLRAID